MRAFLLSPARLDGRRAQILLRPQARFPLATRLRGEGAALGEVYEFLSGLYFRGKLAYARAFSTRSLVITPSRGLLSADERVTAGDLAEFAGVPIDEAEDRYRLPMEASARMLEADLGARGEVVLLGSIATGKYVDVLVRVFGDRLLFPSSFVGRGDMSRGGLLLRSAREGRELEYAPVRGAVRHGARPPRLARLR